MIPLALTSTRDSIRRLGGKRWNRLHELIYPIAVLGVIHFWMAVKKDISDPMMYGACVAVLLVWRVVRWWMRREAAATRVARRGAVTTRKAPGRDCYAVVAPGLEQLGRGGAPLDRDRTGLRRQRVARGGQRRIAFTATPGSSSRRTCGSARRAG